MAKVLVPIDGSPAALRALRHAMNAATDIHIINVQRKAEVPALLLHMTQSEIDKSQREHGRSMLSDAGKVLNETGRAYRAHVAVGDPAAEIVRIADSEHVDLIVMGTRGMSALGNLALGSTATKVVHLSKVPVTLVRK
jgi:nucleotide-binding universal stress UspA family protein